MKSIVKVFALVLGVGLTGAVYAECPDDLPVPLLLDCIVVEGAGDDFDAAAAIKEYNKAESDNKLAATE